MEGCCALIIDISDVKHLGVSAALSLEESIMDMCRAGRSVYIVAANGQPIKRLDKSGLLKFIPPENLVSSRMDALEILLENKPDNAFWERCENIAA